ncbi:hypothetical protein D9623_07300 [Azospirillum brasilense]|uniref:Lipoprotein n=1 Tax=Azospirillum brasilense TaxID=192 RepID=A0A0P0EY73_AZOBR|nr:MULTISPECIES: hypothetical protein [Azospirillum]ALJ35053.1 hypothetical protein AMK58_06245 [Azospirillum brasilense]MDW7553547.1 hypothetical protein [Azospirillum brasilense]MDW7594247.1 hypothetical protein [Azospirillum brasilense]MDW7629119.1 hypothetical protein [Azospirillum brasilense]MDX5953738.1 hypothetical protein [Azospirillum brasilense]
MTRSMRCIRSSAVLAVLAATLLTACQTTGAPAPSAEQTHRPPPTVTPASPLSDAPGRIVAQNKGWVVRAHPATKTGSAYCYATRTDDSSPLSFRATAKGAAMLVNADQHAQADKDTESRLTAIFPDGETMALEASPLPDGGVVVPVELPKYEDLFEPFMRSRAVTLQRDGDGTEIGDVNLGGSSWALAALDECRILHTDK